MYKSLRSRRFQLALTSGVLLSAVVLYSVLVKSDPLDPNTWLEPVLLRSVNVGKDEVVAVGGSRDGNRIGAAVCVSSDQARVIVVESSGHRSFDEGPYRKLAVQDVDVSSEANTNRAIASTVVREIVIASGEKRIYSHSWTIPMRFNATALSPNEECILATGGHFFGPGCSTGETPSSIALFGRSFLHDQRELKINRDGIGVAGAAWAPNGNEYATVGIDGSWAQWERAVARNGKSAADRTSSSPSGLKDALCAIKVWDRATGDLEWDWNSKIDASDRIPIACAYSADGKRLFVGYGVPGPETVNPYVGGRLFYMRNWRGFRMDRLEVRDANLGTIIQQIDLPSVNHGAIYATLVGVAHEEIVLLAPNGLWRTSLAGGGDWQFFEIPKSDKLTCMKTARDRKHLLAGDAGGRVHVLGWP